MVDERLPRALPRDVPNYHMRQADHLRALAATTTTSAIKERLLREAAVHEDAARDEEGSTAGD